jgi:hypothetical protein
MDEPSAVELANKHMLSSFRQHLSEVGVPVRIPEEDVSQWADHDVDWENDEPPLFYDEPYETGLGLVPDRDEQTTATAAGEGSAVAAAVVISAANNARLEVLRVQLSLPSMDALLEYLCEHYTLTMAAQRSADDLLSSLLPGGESTPQPQQPQQQKPTAATADAATHTTTEQPAEQSNRVEKAEQVDDDWEDEPEANADQGSVPAAAGAPKMSARPSTSDSGEAGAWSSLLFDELQVRRATLPFGLPPMPPPERSDVLAAKTDIEFVFMLPLPDAYVRYCVEIGHGTLGRCRIFAPCSELNPHDLRLVCAGVLLRCALLRSRRAAHVSCCGGGGDCVLVLGFTPIACVTNS